MNVVHECPTKGRYKTECCNRSVFQLDAHDRMTTNPKLVTCRRAVTYPSGSAT